MGKLKQLAEAFQRAQAAADAAYELNKEDGGTCNFDQPIIKLNWHITLKQKAENYLAQKISSGFWRGYYFMRFNLKGQAACRTRMAEAAYKSLKADGYDVAMYYQAD